MTHYLFNRFEPLSTPNPMLVNTSVIRNKLLFMERIEEDRMSLLLPLYKRKIKEARSQKPTKSKGEI